MPLELSATEARVLALRQLGVDSDRDASVLDVVDRLGLLQVDSVNVFERAHYMPLFSRLGKFDKAELENLMGGFHPTLIEYWAHEASIIRLDNWPLYRWRIRRKIYVWYNDLRELEAVGRAADNAVERTEVRAKLADLQAETSKVEVPVSYTDDLYRLRAHIRFVAEIIDKLAGQERHERI